MSIIKSGGLRPQIRDTLREWIVIGQLAPGAPLRESTISLELGVSRTPVREALAQLEQEGLVRSTQGCGFSVAPLTVKEMKEVFPIVGSLQATALRYGGMLSKERIRGLRAMNEIIGSNGDPRMIVVEDIHWHGLLLSGCTNRRLLHMLDEIEAIVHRYDLAYFAEGGDARCPLPSMRRSSKPSSVAILRGGVPA